MDFKKGILVLPIILLTTTFVSVFATTTFVDPFDISGQDTTPNGLAFNSDGTKMFMVGLEGYVSEYACSTGFDVSTCSYSGNAERLSVSSQDNYHFDLAFNSDGTKMFTSGIVNDSINEYTCSTGFDVST